jgi:capsular exopolysaccharide synthesis family protein
MTEKEYPQREYPMTEREVHLRDYLRILSRRKSTMITVFVLIFAAGVIATFTASSRPMYQASAKAVIERNTAYSLTGRRYEGYTGYDPNFLQTQTQIIKSEGVAEKVVDAIGAGAMYEAYFPEGEQAEKGLAAWIRKWGTDAWQAFREAIGIQALLSEAAGDQAGGDAAGNSAEPPTKTELMKSMIRSGISVTPIEETKVVSISFTSPNPVLAKRIANSVAQAYIDQLLDMRMEMSGYSIDWMKKKADLQREKLEKSEQALHEYKKKHNIVTIEDRLAILPERLAEFSDKLTKAEARRKELETIYSQVKGKTDEELEAMSVIAEDASVDSINQRILEAEQKISELSRKYGPKHPRMIAAQNELEQLRGKKHKELQQAVKTIENEYRLARKQEEKLREMLEQTKYDTARLNEKSIQLGILKRKVETNKYLYDALIKRMEEKGLTEKTQLVNVWVIEEAKTPQAPIPENRNRKLLLTLVLGVFGGVGLAFFFEYLDNTVKSPDEIEEKFDVPVIGTIERLKDKRMTILEKVMENTASALTEGFKTLRTSILLSAADNPPRVLLVTSMGTREGKSSVSSCLAVSMAQNGLQVLLIDGDMRRPQVHHYFNLESRSGLSSYLSGTDTRELIHKGVVENLDVMTAGPIPPNPSELLSADRTGFLLGKSRQRYDMIIIDSPPLGVADGIILSSSVDGVLLLAAAGETRYDMLEKGIRQLRDVSARISGIVLNKFDAKKSGYYYNYGDYYYSAEG